MYYGYDMDSRLVDLANEAEERLRDIYKIYEENSFLCSSKVLKAFQDYMVNGSDFNEVRGYGYNDPGRDKLEAIYARVFNAEDALVRPQIMSGTHALSLTFFGLLKHGDTLVSITGAPYDSLLSVIGLSGNSRNSLMANGVRYEQIDLVNNDFDIEKIVNRLKKDDVKLVEIQRSRGYSSRKSLTIKKIERVIKAIREVNKNVIIMVDNCYGDFVENREPIEVGADIIVGSLMKNLGGGEAKTGGYIVGRKDLVNDVAERFSAPCIGKDIGANLNENFHFYKGLYMAPSVVCSSLKTMTFAAYLLEKLGFEVDPKFDEIRTDIIQTITLKSKDNLESFCGGIQMACPVDSYVTPIAAPMPGYPSDVVMASGSFIEGSTIELSCDGPAVEPFIGYMQGGLTYEYGKVGVLLALDKVLKKNS